jgi:hypothetical protein
VVGSPICCWGWLHVEVGKGLVRWPQEFDSAGVGGL